MKGLKGASGVLFVLVAIPGPLAGQAGVPFGAEFQVSTYTSESHFGAHVAFDSSGNFVVVWSSRQDGSGFGVFGQRYSSSGAPAGTEFRVNTYTTNNQFWANVASDSSGNFVVVWESLTLDYWVLGSFGQRFASSGSPLGSEFEIAGYGTAPGVASDSSGNFVVVWNSYRAYTYWDVAGQRYASSGSPVGALFRVNTYTTGWQLGPSVACDPSGNFVVVWNDALQDGSGFGVFGQRYGNSGAPTGPEFPVNTYTTNDQSIPSVALDSSGSFVVVWRSARPDGLSDVFGRRYVSSGTPAGGEFQINTDTLNQPGTVPSVASDSSGNFVVVWISPEPAAVPYDVFGQRYSSSGAPLGAAFRVDTFTTGDQLWPSVASDSSGKFVVVWDSFRQVGSYWGVFGQRYSRIASAPLRLYTVQPCRLVDTRNPAGTFGGPPLVASALRTFPIAGQCNVPSDTLAVSANVAVVSPSAAGYLTFHAAGTPQPLASTINFAAGQTRTNNAVVSLDGSPPGAVAVWNGSSGTVDLVIDINGYFK